jgi:hypothetical protein
MREGAITLNLKGLSPVEGYRITREDAEVFTRAPYHQLPVGPPLTGRELATVFLGGLAGFAAALVIARLTSNGGMGLLGYFVLLLLLIRFVPGLRQGKNRREEIRRAREHVRQSGAADPGHHG